MQVILRNYPNDEVASVNKLRSGDVLSFRVVLAVHLSNFKNLD